MKRPKRNADREDRIYNEAIVDASPDEQAMSWYYYLEGKISFPFRASCLAANAVSPLRKGENVEVLRMAAENACEHDMLVANPVARAEDGRPSLPTGHHRRERINQGGHWRLALLGRAGRAGSLPLIYTSSPKTHGAVGAGVPRDGAGKRSQGHNREDPAI
jgi:hypothetical protein